MTALDTLANLKKIMNKSKPSKSNILTELSILAELLLQVENEERESIIESGGYGLITNVWTKVYGKKLINAKQQKRNKEPKITEHEEQFLDPILSILSSITPGHPDITDKICNDLILRGLHPKTSEEIKIKSLKLLRNICIKCERNRIVLTNERNVIPPFVRVIRSEEKSQQLAQAWVEAFGALILNDDPRFIVNQSAETKYSLLKAGAVHELALLITKFRDISTMKAIINAIQFIGNGEEYCSALDEVGALDVLEQQILLHMNRPKFLTLLLKCLRNFSTNSTFRERIEKTAMMADVLTVITKYKSDESFLQLGIATLGSMTVNSPCTVTQFIIGNGIPIIIEAMKTFGENLNILKSSCFTLRNVGANGGKIGKKLLSETDIEDLLSKINAVFADELESNYINPLLKAIGVEVPSDEGFDDSVSQRASIETGSSGGDDDDEDDDLDAENDDEDP